MGFDTEITLTGPLRSPAQMLALQDVGGHGSVHDDRQAAALGLAGAPIEGPTHFSQFDPLAFALWGPSWFEHACISSHFRSMVVEGEQVRASLTTGGSRSARIEADKADGTTVLVGTASLGPDQPRSELEGRLAAQGDPGDLVIVDRLHTGMRQSAGTVSVTHAGSNGAGYPFSLAEKLERITEPHPWYTPDGGATSPWGQAILPIEMISVLACKSGPRWPVRSPVIGLFLDVEVRLLGGPVLVGRDYLVESEIVGLGQSRRTESYWDRTDLSDPQTGQPVASVLIHHGVFKDSYPDYPRHLLA